MKIEKVYIINQNKNVFAKRQSNQTILLDRRKTIDSDRLMIEDKRGFRYARNSIDLEKHCEGFYILNMI